MKTFHYIDMTHQELEALDRSRTVIFSSISPIETHGPHLPLGTDLYIAEAVRDAIITSFGEKHPDFSAVVLPTFSLGANAIPVSGSMQVSYQAVKFAVLDTGRTLADLGFRYWVLTDNHGGPAHQIAIETASRKLARKNLDLMAPFHEIFRRMVRGDPDLIKETGLGPGRCGDVEDSHAGTNETSLMLFLHPDKVRDTWKTLGPGKKSSMKLPARVLAGIGRILGSAGFADAATDFHFLSNGLAWISDPQMASYQGNPSLAGKEAGDAMFRYHVRVGEELLEEAIAGRRKELKPLGWSVRLLKIFM